jgi:putative phage-type endonuclease
MEINSTVYLTDNCPENIDNKKDKDTSNNSSDTIDEIDDNTINDIINVTINDNTININEQSNETESKIDINLNTENDVNEISEIEKLNNMKRLRNRVKSLLKKPQPIQRSPEWYRARNTIITASEVASCLTLSKKTCEKYVKLYNIKNFKYNDIKSANVYDSLDEYIIKKCKSFYGENVFNDSVYTLWGKKYEPIAVNLYKKVKNTEVYDFGLLRHPYLKWLGASPDGITPDGVMLEIKCPYSRKIKDSYIPFHYYCQVQIQLQSTLLDEADFLECEIKEMKSLEEYTQCTDIKGIIINKINEPDNSETKYIYQDVYDTRDPIDWANTYLTDENKITYTPIYYKIQKYSILNIKKDQEWFDSVKDDIKRVHSIITHYQNNQEDFMKYIEKINKLKNKKHIEAIENSVCLL